MTTVRFGALVGIFFSVLVSARSWAWTHIARQDETLNILAVLYYGDANKTMVIRAANGFVHPDDGRFTAGERVEIPETELYMTVVGDTWASIADRFLGAQERGPYLAKLNNYETKDTPPVGTLITIPYQLRHMFAARESLKSVTEMYFDRQISSRWLLGYNLSKKKRYEQGEVILIPIWELHFVPEQQVRIDQERASRYSSRDKQNQEKAMVGVAEMKQLYEKGEYVACISLGKQLVGRGSLTVPQKIAVQNFLGSAYVAVGENSLAENAFAEAISLQPAMELSAITTSPKILEVFERVKDTAEKAQNKAPVAR